MLDQCANNWKESLVVGKYDVQSGNDELKVELLLLGVMPQALPALILIHKNKVLTTWKGVIRAEELDAMLDEHINDVNNVFQTVGVGKTVVEDAHRRKSGFISFASVGAGDEYMVIQS